MFNKEDTRTGNEEYLSRLPVTTDCSQQSVATGITHKSQKILRNRICITLSAPLKSDKEITHKLHQRLKTLGVYKI